MKKKIIMLLIIAIIIVIAIVIVLLRNNTENNILDREKNIEDFKNCIMHRGDYNDGYYDSVYVFLENGEYYYFFQQYDAMVRNKAYKGVWRLQENIVIADIEKAVYLDGGETVNVEKNDKFINDTKIINGELKVREFKTTFTLNFKEGKEKVEKYSDYLVLMNDSSYYPIYEYRNVEKAKAKLKEMYGDIFTLLEQ